MPVLRKAYEAEFRHEHGNSAAIHLSLPGIPLFCERAQLEAAP